MITSLTRGKSSSSFKGLCLFLAVTFFMTTVIFPGTARAQSFGNLPIPGTMVNMTPVFAPPIMKGVIVDPQHPFQFKFIIDTGDDHVKGVQLKKEADKLIKYFLASVTVPDTDLWVNLSPYEKDRIVPEGFGSTEMGRDLLAQDYILKQLTASLIYPEDELGKKFWDRVYKKAYEQFGTTDIPVNTFNKVWVIPDKAVVYEYQGRGGFVVERHLKVMLEEDYVSLQNNINNEKIATTLSNASQTKNVSSVSSQIVREILIPEIEKEVNFGKNFATLRQIYNAMILSTWYKRQLRDSIFAGVYANQNKIAGVNIADKNEKQKIYNQYLAAFKKGVCDYIKAEFDSRQERMIPRKYFSGGCQHVSANVIVKKNPIDLTTAQEESLEKGSGPFVVVDGTTVPTAAPTTKQEFNDRNSGIQGKEVPLTNQTPAAPEKKQEFNDRNSGMQGKETPLTNQAPATPKQENKMPDPRTGSFLEKGWVIANHILVSFHAAFISSLLSLPGNIESKWDVLSFVFLSPETIVSTFFLWLTWHSGIAIHEMGHYLTAVKIDALKGNLLPDAKKTKEEADKNILKKVAWYAKMFALIPYGKFKGVTKSGLNYYADAPYNNRVKAAGPGFSRVLGITGLTLSGILITAGLTLGNDALVYAGRLCLGVGAVGMLDFRMADPGEYRKYKARKKQEAEDSSKAEAKTTTGDAWIDKVAEVKQKMMTSRPQVVTLLKKTIRAPWQYRNSGMGGRHTLKEYPESNISMQEMMFVPLRTTNYEEFQEMTVKLQNKLKEIIEDAEGGRVMGIGLEGGLAPYVEKEKGDIVAEQRLWRMGRDAIIKSGYVPGVDVALAFDPAASELEIAYREEMGEPDAVGMYLFWRDNDKVTMTRDELLELYKTAIVRDNVPIVSIEDGFAEDDHDGWKLIMKEFGDKLFIIGDDSVTTRDSSIESAADAGELNTFLVKANQIGTLSETIIALAVAIGKGVETVTSHRSKSPNDDMEAHIALAARSVGLKTGGGANTERLQKYGAVIKIMAQAIQEAKKKADEIDKGASEAERQLAAIIDQLEVTSVVAMEDATNAGIPTVKIQITFGIPGSSIYEKLFSFDGATPLGTSAGTGEAIHLVDSVIDPSQVSKEEYLPLFKDAGDGSLRFKKEVTQAQVEKYNDEQLNRLFIRSKRYEGKGCLNAVDNVNNVLAKAFIGLKLSEIGSIEEIDRKLLTSEVEIAVKRGQLRKNSDPLDVIEVMQRKGNIGMNAILSQSLATARLVANMQGKDLWEVVDETLRKTMAKTIATSKGEDWTQLYRTLSFEQLSQGLQEVNRTKPSNVKLYELIRQELNVYGEGIEVARTGSSVIARDQKTASSNIGGINLNSNLMDLKIKRDASGSPLPVNQQPIMHMNVDGFKFNIMTIKPIANLPMFLGFNQEPKAATVSL